MNETVKQLLLKEALAAASLKIADADQWGQYVAQHYDDVIRVRPYEDDDDDLDCYQFVSVN